MTEPSEPTACTLDMVKDALTAAGIPWAEDPADPHGVTALGCWVTVGTFLTTHPAPEVCEVDRNADSTRLVPVLEPLRHPEDRP
jgi:hypothetical protein